MRKNVFALIATAAVVMTGCSKENITKDNTPAGVPMSFNVSIAGTDTKATYTPDGGALKVAWEAGDQVSVVSFNASNIAQTCDTFTTSGAGDNVTFTGTYTGEEDAPKIKVIYPALTDSNSEKWLSPLVAGQYTEARRFELNKNDVYCRYRFSYANQLANNDPSHLKYYDSMSAMLASVPDLTDVTLVKHSSVVKLDIDMSAIPNGSIIKYATVSRVGSIDGVWGVGDWGYSASEEDFGGRNGNGSSWSLVIYFGSNSDGQGSDLSHAGITKIAGEDRLVAYIPFMAKNHQMPKDSQWKIEVKVQDDGYYTSKTVTLPASISIPVGSCYTFSATVTK